MKPPFYISTPIYYSNGVPHIGHTYTTLIAETIARYKRFSGYETKFSTGVDENSQKVVEKAEEQAMTPEAYADMMAAKHRAVWDNLGIEYTDFVRTRDPRHFEVVRDMLQRSYDAGDIYLGTYEGKYCVGCEAYKRDEDLNEEGRCPDHPNRDITILSETNYFFRLSKYQDRLLELYESQPDFVMPEYRFREIIEFVRGGLEDFSISREGSTFGIPLPFDESHVTYVWYDALFNYYTACTHGQERFFPADVHVVGKEILRFHAVYWPAMLWSVGLPLPKNILANGFFTIDGQKISKSVGNVIDPVEYVQRHSRELMQLYLLYAFPVGADGDFSHEHAVDAYNAHLANNIGNLLNRFLVLSLKIGWNIPSIPLDDDFANEIQNTTRTYREAMDRYELRKALEITIAFADFLNKYLDTTRPWEYASDETRHAELVRVLAHLGEGVRTLGVLLASFFPKKAFELLERIGRKSDIATIESWKLQESFQLRWEFFVAEKGVPLFARVEPKSEENSSTKP